MIKALKYTMQSMCAHTHRHIHAHFLLCILIDSQKNISVLRIKIRIGSMEQLYKTKLKSSTSGLYSPLAAGGHMTAGCTRESRGLPRLHTCPALPPTLCIQTPHCCTMCPCGTKLTLSPLGHMALSCPTNWGRSKQKSKEGGGNPEILSGVAEVMVRTATAGQGPKGHNLLKPSRAACALYYWLKYYRM